MPLGPEWVSCRDPTLVGARQLHPSKLTVRRLQQSFAECQTSAKRFASRDAPTLLNYYAAAPLRPGAGATTSALSSNGRFSAGQPSR